MKKTLLLLPLATLVLLGAGCSNSSDGASSEMASTSISIVSSTASSAPGSDTASITVKELGIRFQVPNELKDITYFVGTSTFDNTQTVYFSTETLTNMDKKSGGHLCDSQHGPIGVIIKSSKELQPGPGLGISEQASKKLSNSWVYFSGPNGECSVDAATANLAINQHNLMRKALTTVEEVR